MGKTDIKKQDVDQAIQLVDSTIKVELSSTVRKPVRVDVSADSGLKRPELILAAFFVITAVILMITATLYLGNRIW